MPAPFYTLNDLIVEVTVTNAAGALNPTSATFDTLNPAGTLIQDNVVATIVANTVRAVVPRALVTTVGSYTVVIDMTLPDTTVRAHVVVVPVIQRPVGT
jgi:hypothetical protein